MGKALAAGPRLIHEIRPRNILSFGPDTPPLKLTNLNVLIGPNGSGKSNFLETISLLRNSPVEYRSAIAAGGGVADWIWKGNPGGVASVEAVIERPDGRPLRHLMEFRREKQSFRLEDERIENDAPAKNKDKPYVFYHFRKGRPVINTVGDGRRKLNPESIDPDTSILAQRRDPDRFPEITYLADAYGRIRLYREWRFGRGAMFRAPEKTDLRTDRLDEDYSNLGMFLNRLRRNPETKATLLTAVRDLYDGLTDFDVSIESGTIQIYFSEGDFSIPAVRLSDGSLRYLGLLAILCDPKPPPLIAIDEPELGLHPDLITKVADLLISASTRTQVIVTTHSDILVDALTETADAVVVCEKHEGRTILDRLDPQELAVWLDRFRLGELWTRGQLGGTRW